MAKFVNDVFVGAGVVGAASPAIGNIQITDEKGTVLTAATAATAKEIRFSVITGPAVTITLPNGTTSTVNKTRVSDIIKKEEIFTPNGYSKVAYAAAVEQVSTVTIPAPAVNTRYTVKLIFRDNQGTKTQISKSFDYVTGDSITGVTATTIAASIASRITRRSKGLVSASAAAGVITITGAKRLDNPGKNTLNNYSQNIFEVSGYFQSTKDYLASPSNTGFVIATTTKAKRGAGTFELVRDAERANLPYQGYENPLAFPVNAPDLLVNAGKTYTTYIIEYNKKYFSADNQYIKETPKSVEVYVEVGTDTTIDAVLTAFIAGSAE